MGCAIQAVFGIILIVMRTCEAITVSSNGNSPQTKMPLIEAKNIEFGGFVPINPHTHVEIERNEMKGRKLEDFKSFNTTKLPVNERYRRLIPYMTFYLANDFNAPQNEEYSPKPQLQKVFIPKNDNSNEKEIQYSNIPRYQGNRLTNFNIASAYPNKILQNYVPQQQQQNSIKFPISQNQLISEDFSQLSGIMRPPPKNNYQNRFEYQQPIPVPVRVNPKSEAFLDKPQQYKLVPYDQTPLVQHTESTNNNHFIPKVHPYLKKPIPVPVAVSQNSFYEPSYQTPQYSTENYYDIEKKPQVEVFYYSPVQIQNETDKPLEYQNNQNYAFKKPKSNFDFEADSGFKPIANPNLVKSYNKHNHETSSRFSTLSPWVKNHDFAFSTQKPKYNYENPAISISKPKYNYEININSTPKPKFNYEVVYSTTKPKYNYEINVSSTPKPQFNYEIRGSSTPKPKYEYEINVSSTPKPKFNYEIRGSSTPKPKYEIHSTEQNGDYPNNSEDYADITPGLNYGPLVGDQYEQNNLADILKTLQHTHSLPKTITSNNVDSSIKTLVQILNKLKSNPNYVKDTTIKPILSTPKPFQTTPSYLQTLHSTPSVPYHKKHVRPKPTIKAKLVHEYPPQDLDIEHGVEEDDDEFIDEALGGTPGKPGIDYPTLAVIPTTQFDCKTQRYKGFFGDPETNCQVWHYCDLNGGQASFLCPNGTIFSQVALTCDWWFNVKCDTTAQLYVLNERLYKYILPYNPKFPEDYSGPLVDKYLSIKYKEMEEKMSKKKKLNRPETELDMEKVDVIEIKTSGMSGALSPYGEKEE